jgi:hypothetical protein
LSSNNAVAVVPATVTVNAGSSTASFAVSTKALYYTAKPTITASYNGVTTASILTIVGLSGLSLNPASVTGGTPVTATLTLSDVAPSGVVISLSSNNAVAVVPATVTINPGSATASFTVTTKAVNYTAKPAITASYNGMTLVGTLTVVGLSGVSLSPTSVTGGSGSTATVTLTGPAPNSVVVSLSSNNAAAAVPPAVTVTSGSSTAVFGVTTTAGNSSTSATIGASFGGLTQTAVLKVGP